MGETEMPGDEYIGKEKKWCIQFHSRNLQSATITLTKRVDNRVDDYIKDSNENNIHDIRTAVRRLDASYRSLPKNMRRKNKISKYMTTSKQLFKVNSQVRDYDIICEKLQKYSSEPIYTKLTGSLNRRRKTKLARARKIALSLRDLDVPQVKESAISAKKLEMRYNKLGVRLRV